MSRLPADRWRQIDALFAAALERAAEERIPFVVEASGEDRGLRDEVLALLEAGEAASRVLGESATEYVTPLIPGLRQELDNTSLPAGTPVGPYAIVREIGRGGMATVYLAERDDHEYRRRVALKVVKRGMDTDEVLRRFRHERQILASLDHPNIARLYDGGATADGRPYLVMELIEGRPIDQYCDENRLTIDERLELFATVCEAVQFAHQKLIVHRDVKPSNILVTEQGEVKLLDFGIAKLLEDDASDSPRTRTGLRLLTPEYAAPELVRGRPVATTADVYSLGVLLHVLLTGQRPTARSGGTGGGEGDEPVEKPSIVAGRPFKRRSGPPPRVTVSPSEIAAARRTTPERLARALRGDLDTIARKALAAEPARRYPSAQQLLDDIRRHLAGHPVLARPDTFGYRFGRYVRRHRSAVAAALLLALALLGGLGAAMWQAGHAARERDAAQEVAAFLEDLFTAPDPYGDAAEGADTMRVRDVLALGAERVRHDLAGQPALQARMLSTLGQVHVSLGALHEARPLLEEALRIRRGLHPDQHPDVAEVQHRLGALLTRTNELHAAEPLLEAALETRRARFGWESPEAASTLNELGVLRQRSGDHEGAAATIEEALAIRRRVLDEDHDDVVTGINTLANVYNAGGAFERAEALYEEAVRRATQRHGRTHPAVARGLQNLATVYIQRGEQAAAEAPLQEALGIHRSAYSADHPATANTLNSLGLLLTDLSRFDEARAALEEGLDMRRRIYGEEHPRVATILNSLAILANARGEPRAAEAYYRESLELRRQIYKDPHPAVATALNNLGTLLRNIGEYHEAGRLLEEAVSMYAATVGEGHPGLAVLTGNLAAVHHAQGDHEAAEPLYREAVELLERIRPSDDPGLARARVRLGRCLTHLDRLDEAEPILVAALEILATGDYRRRALEGLATLYGNRGDHEAESEILTLLANGS